MRDRQNPRQRIIKNIYVIYARIPNIVKVPIKVIKANFVYSIVAVPVHIHIPRAFYSLMKKSLAETKLLARSINPCT